MTESQSAPSTETPSCPKCGGAMWDNRENKRNPRAPDFKCRDKGNCDGVIWPPREAGAPAASAAGVASGDTPPCPKCGGPMWDDRATKRNPRAPDFKCRNKPKQIGGEGCEGVIWPPRDGERRAPASATPAPAPRARVQPSAPPPSRDEFAPLDDAPPFDDDLPF